MKLIVKTALFIAILNLLPAFINSAAAQWKRLVSIDYTGSTQSPLGIGLTFLDVKNTSVYISGRYHSGKPPVNIPKSFDGHTFDKGNGNYGYATIGYLDNGYEVMLTNNSYYKTAAVSMGLSHCTYLTKHHDFSLVSRLGFGYAYYNYFSSFNNYYQPVSPVVPKPVAGYAKISNESASGLMAEASLGLNYKHIGIGVGTSNIAFKNNMFDLIYRLSWVIKIRNADENRLKPFEEGGL
ncbi:MAG: hypothetical protein V4543_18270 [Bacteroidota bacterium]